VSLVQDSEQPHLKGELVLDFGREHQHCSCFVEVCGYRFDGDAQTIDLGREFVQPFTKLLNSKFDGSSEKRLRGQEQRRCLDFVEDLLSSGILKWPSCLGRRI
jgi:hypothetical protein